MTPLDAGIAAKSVYSIARWTFVDSAGRWDVDLGNSYVPSRRLSDLTVPADLKLDYGTDRGTTELRDRIAGLYGGRPESVTVTHGAQEALFLLFDVLLRPGDQVIAFNPGWQPLLDLPPRLDASVTVLPYGPDLSVDAAAVTAAAGENLRLIALNSPCNPTGLRVEEEELRALVALVAERDAYLLVDEEYAIDLSRSPAVGQDRVISVSGLSKTYGLPGLRTGWVYGAPQVAEACAERKFLTSIANSVLCEALACSALDRHENYAREYHRLCAPGLRLVEKWAARHPDAVRLVPPQGTPFAWIQLRTGETSLALCRRALEAGLLLTPGETMGSDEGFRLGFARDVDTVTEGLRRLDTVLLPDGPSGG
ncbi:Aspartate/methionine/tyrosine aminotransferase [Streptomyces sp. WMMB 714]|uniref:pyridoxal phosphate-dependent aminotransferase n=1 Tax=Streptomyces sp. WMMB 714 TaxID=1286822 RepID=UPI0005F79242|nr:pyridoxal phosphate-dependent aminotransferase [Streptomyces sp. WMMB 714]SCK46285.1 Aspartate/methionine/tyrosine aminotransferase [Streptomyces sp. WMMB 714]